MTDDQITHNLFEWIENKEKTQFGKVTLPDDLFGLNHRGQEILVKYSKSIKLYANGWTKSGFLELLQFMTDREIPEVEKIKETIGIIEKRAKISVKDYLGFDRLTTPIKTEM
jgi:hypothetical protein